MARVYPSAGSAYTYVGKEIHPLAGYVVVLKGSVAIWSKAPLTVAFSTLNPLKPKHFSTLNDK